MINGHKKIWTVILFLTVDLLLLHAGYMAAFWLKFGRAVPPENLEAYRLTWPWLTLTAAVLFYFYGLYGSYRWRWTEVFASLLCAVFFQAVAGMAVTFFARGFAFPRTVLLLSPLVQLLLLGVWRRAAWHLERKFLPRTKVLVAGGKAEAASIAAKLESLTGGAVRVAGLVLEGEDGEAAGRRKNTKDGAVGPYPVLGLIEDFDSCLLQASPDQVFICSGVPLNAKASLVMACLDRGVKVFLVPDLYEILLAETRLEQVDDIPVFAIDYLAIPQEAAVLKRITDVLFSLAALALTLPVFVLAALAVKLDSPGPVFYRQKRLTLQGKPFYIYKFRTMVVNAEINSGPVLAAEDDPRVTRVGRFLRAFRLDELPQLINVLKGDMSVVGPRPERPYFVRELARKMPEYTYRMNVKSGITGLAQVAGRYSTSPEYKLKYDLLYTKSYSLAKDLAILLQTVKVLLMKDRAS